jgi:hypothetical protein
MLDQPALVRFWKGKGAVVDIGLLISDVALETLVGAPRGQWAGASAAATVAGIGAALPLRLSPHENTEPVGQPA